MFIVTKVALFSSSFSWQTRKCISYMHPCRCEPTPAQMMNLLHALCKPRPGWHEYFQQSQFHSFVQHSIPLCKLCNSFPDDRKLSFILIKFTQWSMIQPTSYPCRPVANKSSIPIKKRKCQNERRGKEWWDAVRIIFPIRIHLISVS